MIGFMIPKNAKEIEPFYLAEHAQEDILLNKFFHKWKRYQIDGGRIVCQFYDEKRCHTLCSGKPGYGCKSISSVESVDTEKNKKGFYAK